MYKVNGYTFNVESITAFLQLPEKEQWGEEELHSFLSTEGMQFVLHCENEDGVSLKNEMKEMKRGKESSLLSRKDSVWCEMWENKQRIQETYTLLKNRWEEIVERAYTTVQEFLLPTNHCTGTWFFVPGRGQKAYCTPEGCAIILGLKPYTESELRFMIASLIYRKYLLTTLNCHNNTTGSHSPFTPVETLLSITHREGLITYVGLQAAADTEFTASYAVTEEDAARYTDALTAALKETSTDTPGITEDADLMSTATRIGCAMARAIDESIAEKEDGNRRGRDMLLGTLSYLGFISFLRHYKLSDTTVYDSKILWKAYELMEKERTLSGVKEDVFHMQ